MPNAKLFNYLHLHFIVFIWGFTAVLGSLISLDAIPLVWFRMAMATIFVGVFVIVTRKRLKFSKKMMGGFFLAGVCISLHWIAFFAAIKVSTVSVALSVLSTGAFFTSLLEPLFYKRKIIGYEVVFGIAVIVGLWVIFSAETTYKLGIALALIAAFLSALFSVINGKFVKNHPASSISFYELLFGVLSISVYLWISNGFSETFFKINTSDWLYLFILASACTAYAFIASLHVMKWLSPYTVMLTINLEPVYGIVLALFVLKDTEYMSSQFYYGAFIILATVIANGIIKNKGKIKLKG